jgi:DNA invertase Pin-like site-specific DNA recombinase
VTVARYHRVSTEDQDPQRQLDATADYVAREFEDTPTEVYVDKSTGTDTARDDYQRLMADVEAGEINVVVVHEVTRISRSIRDLDRTVERMESHDTALHIISEGIVVDPEQSDPYQRALLQLLGVFAELEAKMGRKRTTEGIAARQSEDDYHHGRPPLGFSKEDGRLVEGGRYDTIVATLEMVQKGDLSKRKAASELDTSRRTVNRALDRAELYGL